MKNIFTIEKAQKELGSNIGYSFDLQSTYNEAQKANGLASSAHAFINTSIKCFLVGLEVQGIELLEKSVDWLNSAILNKEKPNRYFPNATEASRLSDLALANWLTNRADFESIKASIGQQEKYFLNIKTIDPTEFSLVVVEYLDGGSFDKIGLYAHELWSNKAKPLEVQTALLFCEAKDNQDDIQKIVKSLLSKKTEEWLSRGHYDRFAKWVKVAYKNSQSTNSSCNVLRGAFEDAKKNNT